MTFTKYCTRQEKRDLTLGIFFHSTTGTKTGKALQTNRSSNLWVNNNGNAKERLLKFEEDILMARRKGGEHKRRQTKTLPSDELRHMRLQRRRAKDGVSSKQLSFEILKIRRLDPFFGPEKGKRKSYPIVSCVT